MTKPFLLIIIAYYFLYFDDSGTFHIKERSGYFVYAGYVFFCKDEADSARRKYRKALDAIKKVAPLCDEYKASNLTNNHKRSLHNAVKGFHSLSVAVKLNDIYNHIISDKKARCRYKDYVLKRSIKSFLSQAIDNKQIDPNKDITLNISVDEQHTATNGYYGLSDSIAEELQHGISNFDYGIHHKSLFNGCVKVILRYCDSKQNYLIQASDILANRVLASYSCHKPNLREKIHHKHLTFP